ncbi:MAG: hypothetical protein WCJ61_11935 [Paludibacter sp.]
MSNSSNQTGILVLVAIVMGSIVSAFMFFGTDVEQKNLSASYGNVTLPNGSFSSSKAKAIEAKYAASGNHSDFTGVSLPSYKKGSSSAANYSEAADVAFPSSNDVAQVEVQANHRVVSARSSNGGAYLRSQLVATTIVGTTDVNYISNAHNLARTDIDASFMLIQARNAEVASSSKQGSKRVAQTAASSSSSTDVNGKQKVKQKIPDPGDPGYVPPSLPIGDGEWLMLMFAGLYGVVSLKSKQLQVKRQNV